MAWKLRYVYSSIACYLKVSCMKKTFFILLFLYLLIFSLTLYAGLHI